MCSIRFKSGEQGGQLVIITIPRRRNHSYTLCIVYIEALSYINEYPLSNILKIGSTSASKTLRQELAEYLCFILSKSRSIMYKLDRPLSQKAPQTITFMFLFVLYICTISLSYFWADVRKHYSALLPRLRSQEHLLLQYINPHSSTVQWRYTRH